MVERMGGWGWRRLEEAGEVSEGRKRSKDNRPANMHNKNVNQ